LIERFESLMAKIVSWESAPGSRDRDFAHPSGK
jgi:hypothetical protein